MYPAVVQVAFLLCATAVELHLALLILTPDRYLRFLHVQPAPAVSCRMRLFCALLLVVIVAIQHVGLSQLLRG
jgi:hypothetical protein